MSREISPNWNRTFRASPKVRATSPFALSIGSRMVGSYCIPSARQTASEHDTTCDPGSIRQSTGTVRVKFGNCPGVGTRSRSGERPNETRKSEVSEGERESDGLGFSGVRCALLSCVP